MFVLPPRGGGAPPGAVGGGLAGRVSREAPSELPSPHALLAPPPRRMRSGSLGRAAASPVRRVLGRAAEGVPRRRGRPRHGRPAPAETRNAAAPGAAALHGRGGRAARCGASGRL